MKLSISSMEIKVKVEKQDKHPISKKFENLVLAQLPIHQWVEKQRRLMKSKKF